jgi:hypothetical protein
MRPACSIGIGTALLACLLPCWGCGSNLEDTPDVSKGPLPGAAKMKKTEEMKAQAKAAAAGGQGMPKGPGRR